MADPTNPHDKFFRASMQNTPVARQFFATFLPAKLSQALDFKSLKLLNTSFVDATLQESISDMVFDCAFSNDNHSNRSSIAKRQHAKMVLLVEHQSKPHHLMAFRVYHYLFNMLYQQWQKAPSKKLPVVYAMVFYHGQQTPYPYSMNLAKCFDDSHGLMADWLGNDVPLIDVNQAKDEELARWQLLGVMAGALKHSRAKDIRQHLEFLENFSTMDLGDPLALNFLKTVLNYLLGTGNTESVRTFIAEANQLPKPVRGEMMTIAEQLKAWGREEGASNAFKITAANLLKDGCEPKFVARNTGLPLSEVLAIQQQIEQDSEPGN